MKLALPSLTGLVLTIATCVHAQQNGTREPAARDDAAAQAFWKGKSLYDAGEFSRAIEQFELAYSLTKDPDLLYDIAQSYRKSDHCAQALDKYSSFLRTAPQSPLATQAEKQVALLQQNCQRDTSVTPSVHVEPAVDVPTQLPRSAPSPARQRVASPVAVQFKVSEGGAKPRPPNTWALIAGSAAVVAGGVALGLELWNLDRLEQWKARDRDLLKGNAAGETDPAWATRQHTNDEFGRSIDRVDRDVIYITIGAGALLATSVAVYLWYPRRTTASVAPGAPARGHEPLLHSITVGSQRGGLVIGGAF